MISVKKSDSTTTLIEVKKYNEKTGINIRDFVKTEKYSGPTKEGMWIPIEKWDAYFLAFTEINKEVERMPKS